MYQSLKERGRAAADYYAGREDYFTLSPTGLALRQSVEPLIEAHCRGRVLDAGAGRCAYQETLQSHAEEYVSMDISLESAASVIGDIQRLPFSDASFDTVFNSQVLEHVPDPLRALEEFNRVLKPGGTLILTIPHISWLHNEPHDYFRFTCHGTQVLMDRTGFEVTSICPSGGLLSLGGHIISTLLMNLTFGIPLLHPLTRWFNSAFVKGVVFFDQRIEKRKVFALNYLCVAKKSEVCNQEVFSEDL